MPAIPDLPGQIRAAIEAAWSAAPIAWPNEPFEAPADAPWLYIEIKGNGASGSGVGSTGRRVVEADGLILAHVFVPVGVGQTPAGDLARSLGAALQIRALPGAATIQTGAADIGSAESGDDDGLWWRV
ncbi:MAG: hypothetical protein RLZZ501_2713, partial [Pseudomonadota bacterium]